MMASSASDTIDGTAFAMTPVRSPSNSTAQTAVAKLAALNAVTGPPCITPIQVSVWWEPLLGYAS